MQAKLLSDEQALSDYRWSSYPHYLQAPSRRPVRLSVGRLFGEWAIRSDSTAGRRQFAAQMEARRAGEREQEFKAVRRGWCLGDKQFRKESLAQMNERRGEWHYGEELQESAQAKAEELIGVELERKGWGERDLRNRRKGDGFKVRLAKRLRAETIVTMKWIAERLSMGSRGHVTHLLYWDGRDKPVKATQQS